METTRNSKSKSGKDCRSFSYFLEESWNCKTEYRVYLTQKCQNLNEMHLARYLSNASEKERDRLIAIRRNTFVTQWGLLSIAPKLAECYMSSGEFPKIHIYDEVCITGAHFSELLYSLNDAVVRWIAERSSDSMEDITVDCYRYIAIHNALLRSVKLQAFRSDIDQIMLEHSFKRILEPVHKDLAGAWMPFMRAASKELKAYPHIENTTFIPTFWLTREEFARFEETLGNASADTLHPFPWHRMSSNGYIDEKKSSTIILWQRAVVRDDANICAHEAFRCHEVVACGGKEDANETRCYGVTPTVLWDAVPSEDLHEAAKNIACCLTRTFLQRTEKVKATEDNEDAGIESYSAAISALTDILNSDYNQLYPPQSHLISTLASLCLFFRHAAQACYQDGETEWGRTIWTDSSRSDLEKISQNYGTILAIAPGFEILCALLARESQIVTFQRPRSFGIAPNDFYINIEDAEAVQSEEETETSKLVEDIEETLYANIFCKSASLGDAKADETDEKIYEGYLVHAASYFAKKKKETLRLRHRRRELNDSYAPWTDYADGAKSTLLGYLGSFPQDFCSFDEKMGALHIMLAEGCVSLRACQKDGKGKSRALCLLRAGENSLSLVAKPFSSFLPALGNLELYAHASGESTASFARAFGRFVQEQEEKRGQFFEGDLGKNLADFARTIYSDYRLPLRYLDDTSELVADDALQEVYSPDFREACARNLRYFRQFVE